MPCIEYVPRKFSADSEHIIQQANEIMEEYRAAGFDITLRSLYYQFVSRGYIPNTQRDYKRLGSIINDARLAGLIDWDSLEDKTRNLASNSHWNNPSDLIRSASYWYGIDKWEDQEYRPEVWVEKDAVVGVIDNICRQLDVSYMSCRGYISQSEMWSAAMRFVSYIDKDQIPVLLHFGDHDPSGIDMSNDIQKRMSLFLGIHYPIRRIALTMDQIDLYKPPPNPAKITDSRFANYQIKYGDDSWELDALEPQVLVDLIESEVLKLRDDDQWDAAVEREERGKERLKLLAETERKREAIALAMEDDDSED
jgi:hypothetical protein